MKLLLSSLFTISLFLLVSFSFDEADAEWTLEVRVNRIEMGIVAPDPNGDGGSSSAVLGVLDDSIVVLKQIPLDDSVISLLKSSDSLDISQAIFCPSSSTEPRCVLTKTDPESARAALMGYLELDVSRGDYHRPPVVRVFLNTIGIDDDCDGVVDRSGNYSIGYHECFPTSWGQVLDSDVSSEGSLELAKNVPSMLTGFSIPDSDGNLLFDGPAILYNNMVIVAVDSDFEYGFALERIGGSWWGHENGVKAAVIPLFSDQSTKMWSPLAELVDTRIILDRGEANNRLDADDDGDVITEQTTRIETRALRLSAVDLKTSPNLSVYLSTLSQSVPIIEVVINDADIASIDEPKGEPDVTVNGRMLRMVQAVDGNWYGYFANNMQVNENNENWDFCSDSPDTSNVLGISTDDSAGCRFPKVDATDSADATYKINPGSSTVSAGQIGLAENVWPFIQLYDYSPDQDITVQYNKGGATQVLTLSFEEAEEQFPFELIPGIEITIERISFQTVEEISPDTTKSSNEDESVEQVPDWIKNNAGWWAEGAIDDTAFVQGIQFLIQEEILIISGQPQSQTTSEEAIPDWIRNNAGWWAEGLIGDTDFVGGLQYMIEHGIIIMP